MFQIFLFFLLAAGCLAAPAADGPPAPYGPPAYKPAPAPYKEEPLPPQPFEYKYGVNDDYSKTAFDKVETQDAYGKVTGSYKVNLPDGRVQVVTYVSDENGYQAEVSYEGEPVYPPPRPAATAPTPAPGACPGPKPGGYGAAPVYKPA